MRKLGSAVTIALALFSVVASLFGSSGPSAANEAIRFVPQLELTDLSPVKVVFAPDDDTLLMVVNSHGRVDIFDISNPGRPVKITEIAAGAADAAFTPKGTPREKVKIVSGGADGTVRLWMLDGKPAAEPFKGHGGRVGSVAFSPDGTRIADGTRIVSGGVDGTVRLWMLDGKPATEPFEGHRGVVRSVAFSPDGTRIVSGGEDGTVRLWMLDGTPAAELKYEE
jgi:WD40 repeat protein